MPTFVDTNVLVYARDTSDADKYECARDWVRHLWETREGRLSIQVLQEYYVTITRRIATPLTPAEARADVVDLTAWRPVVIDLEELEVSWSIQDRFGLSFWDSLIVAAAQAARCETLLTEDLQDGMEFDGLRVVDPFRNPSATPRDSGCRAASPGVDIRP